ncbi:MAG: hypothetical protein IMF11_02810, partial [Proteobacteria bacterium]|nr:hypothetical protein [Pseudomonadota bacterium]
MFDFFRKRRERKTLRDEEDRALFVQRFNAFRQVLKSNNEVLMTMADMQEKATGDFVFDRAYVQSSYQAMSDGVKRIIDNLNVLGDEKYKGLIVPFQKTDEAIRKQLTARVAIPKTDFVLALKDLGKETVASAGGKLAHMAELANVLGLP